MAGQGQRSTIQEMEEEFTMISIEDEEQGGITCEENADSLSEIDTRWCLVGKFLTDSSLISKPCSTKWLHYGGQIEACMSNNWKRIAFYFSSTMRWTLKGFVMRAPGRSDDSNLFLRD